MASGRRPLTGLGQRPRAAQEDFRGKKLLQRPHTPMQIHIQCLYYGIDFLRRFGVLGFYKCRIFTPECKKSNTNVDF